MVVVFIFIGVYFCKFLGMILYVFLSKGLREVVVVVGLWVYVESFGLIVLNVLYFSWGDGL